MFGKKSQNLEVRTIFSSHLNLWTWIVIAWNYISFSKDFDVTAGSEWLILLTYDFNACDYFVKHVVEGESDCAKPGRDFDGEDWFNEIFVKNLEDELVNLKFVKLAEEEKMLLTFWEDVFCIELERELIINHGA